LFLWEHVFSYLFLPVWSIESDNFDSVNLRSFSTIVK
jgi:hypothetical protein